MNYFYHCYYRTLIPVCYFCESVFKGSPFLNFLNTLFIIEFNFFFFSAINFATSNANCRQKDKIWPTSSQVLFSPLFHSPQPSCLNFHIKACTPGVVRERILLQIQMKHIWTHPYAILLEESGQTVGFDSIYIAVFAWWHCGHKSFLIPSKLIQNL